MAEDSCKTCTLSRAAYLPKNNGRTLECRGSLPRNVDGFAEWTTVNESTGWCVNHTTDKEFVGGMKELVNVLHDMKMEIEYMRRNS